MSASQFERGRSREKHFVGKCIVPVITDSLSTDSSRGCLGNRSESKERKEKRKKIILVETDPTRSMLIGW